LTKEELKKEYIKCHLDFEYVCNTYFRIEDKRQGKFIPFTLLPHQHDLLESYETYDNVISNKYRQAGVTTFTCAYAAWLLNFQGETKIAVIANRLDLAKEELFKKINEFLNSLPDFLRVGLKKDTEKLKIFENGSELLAKAAGKQGLRGFSPNLVILDELAFFEYGDEFWTAAKPSLSMGGKIFAISTPQGRSNLFYKLVEGAKTKQNTFKHHDLKWYHDTRLNHDLEWIKGDERIVEFDKEKQDILISKSFKPTSTWYRQQCIELLNDKKKIAQELEGSFVGSSSSVIDEEYIIQQEIQNVRDPLFYEGFEKDIWIWKKPIKGRSYIMGVDCSSGVADDFATFSILDVIDREQVAEYKGKVQPDILGELAYAWGREYNDAYMVVDLTGGWGSHTIRKLLDLGYKNLHYSEIKEKSAQAQLEEYAKNDGSIPGFLIGINRTELVMCIEMAFRMNEIVIKSSRLCSEIKTFIMKNGRPDHAKGCNDDTLWALILAYYVSQNNISKVGQSMEKTKAMIDSWVVMDYKDYVPQEVTPQQRMENNNGPDSIQQRIDNNFFIL
jgi:hypothetical protein